MRESKAEPGDTMTGPITAQPGTAEYQQQFDKQALGAADSILRLWFVRVVCGLFGIVFLFQGVKLFNESGNWIEWLFFFIIWLLVSAELAGVALFGRSFSLRYMMSGVKRKG